MIWSYEGAARFHFWRASCDTGSCSWNVSETHLHSWTSSTRVPTQLQPFPNTRIAGDPTFMVILFFWARTSVKQRQGRWLAPASSCCDTKSLFRCYSIRTGGESERKSEERARLIQTKQSIPMGTRVIIIIMISELNNLVFNCQHLPLEL